MNLSSNEKKKNSPLLPPSVPLANSSIFFEFLIKSRDSSTYSEHLKLENIFGAYKIHRVGKHWRSGIPIICSFNKESDISSIRHSSVSYLLNKA